jgi:hypothetical protein
MGIFPQKWHFSKVLIIWKARVRVFAVCKASCKTSDNLRG